MQDICEKVWKQSPHTQLPCPKIVTISFPGLNNYKIVSEKPIPGGDFAGLSIKQALQKFKYATISSIIFGSNDWENLFKNNVEKAVDIFMKRIQHIYDKTNFKIVLISTIFPRREMLLANRNVYRCRIQEFNNCLLEQVGKRELHIHNLEGKLVVLKWKIINMTETLPYEKMLSPEMYCLKDKSQTHVQEIYFIRFLEILIENVKRSKMPKVRPRVKGGKRKAEVSKGNN